MLATSRPQTGRSTSRSAELYSLTEEEIGLVSIRRNKDMVAHNLLRATIESVDIMLYYQFFACFLPGRNSSLHNPCIAVTEYSKHSYSKG